MAPPEGLRADAGLTSCFVVSPVAVLMYDYLLTFDREVSLAWHSPWSIVKVLFLLTRYLPFVSLSFLFSYTLLPATPSIACRAAIAISESTMLLGIAASQSILFVRTWALWNRDVRIGVFLGVVFAGGFIASMVIILLWLVQTILFAGFDDSHTDRCFTAHVGGLNAAGFGVVLVMEAVVLILTIVHMVRQYRLLGKERLRGSLANVLYCDGLIFFVYMFLLSVINISLALTVKGLYQDVAASVQQVLHSVLPGRVLLNLRAAQREEQTMASLSDIKFMSPEHPANDSVGAGDASVGASR